MIRQLKELKLRLLCRFLQTSSLPTGPLVSCFENLRRVASISESAAHGDSWSRACPGPFLQTSPLPPGQGGPQGRTVTRTFLGSLETKAAGGQRSAVLSEEGQGGAAGGRGCEAARLGEGQQSSSLCLEGPGPRCVPGPTRAAEEARGGHQRLQTGGVGGPTGLPAAGEAMSWVRAVAQRKVFLSFSLYGGDAQRTGTRAHAQAEETPQRGKRNK